jgi:hypothetical protein
VLTLAPLDTSGFGPLSDHESLIPNVRSFAQGQGAAIISVVTLFDRAQTAAQFIWKKPEGSGYRYGGMYVVPFGRAHMVLTLMCGEGFTTGTREAMVTMKLAEAGELNLRGPEEPHGRGQIEGWFEDPYDLDYPGPVLNSISDSERYDEMLPDHALSRLRATLAMLRRTLSIAR